MQRLLRLFAFPLLLIAVTPRTEAHFPWITIDDEGHAIYFFGETPADRTYKLPPSISAAKVALVAVKGKPSQLELDPIDSDDFVGMKSVASVPKDVSLASRVTYGVYRGSRLDYYTQHVGGSIPSTRAAYKRESRRLDLHAELIDSESGVDVYVIWKGEPLADAEVRLFCEEGHEEGMAKTDSRGKVSFSDNQVEDGLNGIVVGHTTQGETGEVSGQSYESVSHYLTATFVLPSDSAESPQTPKVSVTDERFPNIPEAVTSFGAAVTGDSLYVYGGHKGRAHQYYVEAQANTLWRIDLKEPKVWESLGTGPRLQGLAMVAHDGKLYRIGGFTAKNHEGDEKDLWSQADVARYDPETKQWEELPPLPEPRSSFDAVVLGDRIYVIGGWSMQGGDDATWLETAHVLDLSKTPLRWQTLSPPPFQRRALSVGAIDGKVYAIGGMQKIGGPSTRVDVFDTETNNWSRGPDLIGEGMDGFGSSAFALGNDLYVTTYSGSLQQLAADGKSWISLKTLSRDRFFHRLVPLSDDELIAIGGASMSSGKFDEIDVIRVLQR